MLINRNTKFKVIRSRKIYPFPGLWNYESETGDASNEIHGKRIQTVWVDWREGMFTAIYNEKEWEIVGMFIADKLLNDKNYLKKIYGKQKRMGLKAISLSKKVLSINLENASLDLLLNYYRKIKALWIGYDCINVPPWFIGGDYYQAKILTLLKSKYNLEDVELESLISSPIQSFSHEEELLLYKAAKNSTNNAVIKVKARQLSEFFFWIPFGYDGPTLNTVDEYIKKIIEISKNSQKNIDKHILELESLQKHILSEHRRIIKKHSINRSDLRLIKQIYDLAEMTDWRKEVTFQIHVAFDKVLISLTQKLNITDHNDLRFISLGELNRMGTGKLKMLISERKKGFLHITYKGLAKFASKNKAILLRKKLFVEKEDEGIIKGQVASRGKNGFLVKGYVKVVMHPREMCKVEEMDILVATMTTPEYVPAMRKSSAIITDEGGVTCHAAIVSRELGIPAIIATGCSTRVLKDGDLVEVDAEKGVVTILKRA